MRPKPKFAPGDTMLAWIYNIQSNTDMDRIPNHIRKDLSMESLFVMGNGSAVN